MNEFVDYAREAMRHPLLREGRILDAAHDFIQACAESPDDMVRRRLATAFLGDLTRLYLKQGTLPDEGIACFWRFVEAVPAWPGQADSLGALDEGPREPVVRRMEEAVAGIRRKALPWALGMRRPSVQPRHLLLVTLPHSGVSAIAPILDAYLAAEGFRVLTDAKEVPGALAEADAQGTRLFAWFHAPYELIEPYLRRQDTVVVYLHRDPRDVLVSAMSLNDPTPAQLFAGIIGYRLDELQLDSAPYFLALADVDPGTWATTFDAMKADVAGTATRILGMLDLPVDEERVRALADSYSFKALAGRKEGEGSVYRRLGPYVVRKGTSGQWREQFDRTCALFFAAKYGHLLMAGGWADSMDWIDEVQG